MPETNYFKNYSPSTGEEIGQYKIAQFNEIKTGMQQARTAQKAWGKAPFKRRTQALMQLRKNIVTQLDEIIDKICLDSGKTRVEALLADVYPVLTLIKYYEKNAEVHLARETRGTPPAYFKSKSYVEYDPLGLIGIISPWNYPFQLAINPIITAVTAGNAAVLKPSEITPLTGEVVIQLFQNNDFIPENLVQGFWGYGETGADLIKAKPDKIFFTGSIATGKKIMQAAGKELIPVELELGGKDPMIVFADAQLGRAAKAAVYGAFSNTGQLCVSVERLYVQTEILTDFSELLIQEAKKIEYSEDQGYGDIGPYTHPDQENKVNSQLKKAVAAGAKIIYDGRNKNMVGPVIITEIDPQAEIIQKETFGAVLPVLEFTDEEEAIRLANSTKYGLNASVWTRDIPKAERVTSALQTGTCMINDVLKNVGNPHLPFGGTKQSGIGRYHGPEGLWAFSNQKSVMITTAKRKREINWFPHTAKLYADLKSYIELIYADGLNFSNLKKLPGFLWRLIRGGD
ncbi:MAG: aldehyde dehydrogenase family protein [Bacillota bacterium]